MAHTFLVFDFGGNEEAAQQARHKLEGWKQGFRLGKKIELKFDRTEEEAAAGNASEAALKEAKEGSKTKGSSKSKPKSSEKAGQTAASTAEPPAQIRLIVRLGFSDHEKLSSQRWLERIPTEEPFKSVSSKIVRAGEVEFNATSELFDSLD